MVNLSLDLFRMEEGTYRLRPQAVDLVALVQTVARELQAHARSKDLRLLLQVPPRPVYAQGEELLCYSILANLLKNALEASPEGAEVRVTVHSADEGGGQKLVLDIHNRGEVPEPVRLTFFEKYATHGKPGGMGLGAYSAQLMARVQHGELRMRSGAAGTTLSLLLPQWHAAVPEPASPERTGLDAQARRMDLEPAPALSLLLVDDDEYNIVVLKSALPGGALAVRTAVNGRAALECVRAARPDVIFMDVEMPVMGGIEAVGRIRALQRERGESPSFIAAFSAHDDEATRRKCLEAGFDLYLSKPASREEVLGVLRRGAAAEASFAQRAKEAASGPVWIDAELADLVPKFLDSRRRMARELADAAARGDREALRATAHKLAGGLAMYGFAEASRASAEVEKAALAGELKVLRRQCEALLQLLEQVQPVVRPA
jgi:CheY-like chemotaxis protein